MKPWIKKIFGVGLLLLVAGGLAAWYIFTQEFEDSTKEKTAFTLNALDLIKEFQQNDSLANKKYTEQMLTVNGRVSEIEAIDSTVNIKMVDTLSGAYIIFAFQQQHIAAAKEVKEGDSVSIKGSCSGGIYSEILETQAITFKRSAINK